MVCHGPNTPLRKGCPLATNNTYTHFNHKDQGFLRKEGFHVQGPDKEKVLTWNFKRGSSKIFPKCGRSTSQTTLKIIRSGYLIPFVMRPPLSIPALNNNFIQTPYSEAMA
ncbi:hypothetical protein JYU34_003531 [Plutella xylostella]|uniref:Uncharacterized protein n=1 Tax=Plutella xylostella TaxID=51655 RepID=A0ABQ7R0E0_PLUXY|nr:hypothetical protein JYU34_003531 [Plutella xylostella]